MEDGVDADGHDAQISKDHVDSHGVTDLSRVPEIKKGRGGWRGEGSREGRAPRLIQWDRDERKRVGLHKDDVTYQCT